MHRAVATTFAGSVASLCVVGVAVAQQQDAQAPQQQETLVSKCVQDLQTLTMQMRQDGYWLDGYPRTGWGGVPTADPTLAPGTAGTAPTAPGTITDPAATPPAAGARPPAGEPVGPWRTTGWHYQPQSEMRVLYNAALVLDRQDNEQACMSVVEAMAARYQEQVAQLQELGVDPAEVTTWRQTQIAEAEPVTDAFAQVRVDNLIGLNVRSPRDEYLGDIGDVILDPQTGGVQYVTVARGGFFGIGESEVVVPWEMLYVTPGRESFVLPVDEATLEAAPEYPSGGLFDQTVTGAIDRQQVDTFWAEHGQTQQQQ